MAVTEEQLSGSWLVLVGFKQLFNGHGSKQMGVLLTSFKASAMGKKEYKSSSCPLIVVSFGHHIFDLNKIQVYNAIHSKFQYCHGCALK